MKELVLGIVFLVISIFLLNGLSIVNTQGNVYYDYSNISTNLIQLFGEPIFTLNSFIKKIFCLLRIEIILHNFLISSLLIISSH